MKRYGFTLIELLVVLAIVGLLAALLFPVFANARKQVRQTVCLSNLRQIGQAVMMYQSDNGGALPLDAPFWSEPHGDDPPAVAFDPLKPYGTTPAVLSCPEWPTLSPTNYEWRFRADLRNGFPRPTNQNRRRIHPEHNSVLAYCLRHLTHGYQEQSGGYVYNPAGRAGMYLVLRANGTVQRVPAQTTQLWCYDGDGGKDNWYRAEDGASKPCWQTYDVFPDEPWPPTFEK